MSITPDLANFHSTKSDADSMATFKNIKMLQATLKSFNSSKLSYCLEAALCWLNNGVNYGRVQEGSKKKNTNLYRGRFKTQASKIRARQSFERFFHQSCNVTRNKFFVAQNKFSLE